MEVNKFIDCKQCEKSSYIEALDSEYCPYCGSNFSQEQIKEIRSFKINRKLGPFEIVKNRKYCDICGETYGDFLESCPYCPTEEKKGEKSIEDNNAPEQRKHRGCYSLLFLPFLIFVILILELPKTGIASIFAEGVLVVCIFVFYGIFIIQLICKEDNGKSKQK